MKKNTQEIEKMAGVAIFFVVIAWLINLATVLYFGSFEKSGTFGDTFGAVNAIFSGLAFVGLIYALLLQKNQLELQRQDLILTRNELAETRKEFKEQNKTLKKQRFENTFFSMLSLHNEIVNNTHFKQSESEYGLDALEEHGRLAFTLILNGLISIINDQPENNNQDEEEIIKNIVENYYDQQQLHLGHYFRNLYGIFRIISNADLSKKEKEDYAKMVCAQISDQELALLFFNSYYYSLGGNFIQYKNEYNIFQNLPGKFIPQHLDQDQISTK